MRLIRIILRLKITCPRPRPTGFQYEDRIHVFVSDTKFSELTCLHPITFSPKNRGPGATHGHVFSKKKKYKPFSWRIGMGWNSPILDLLVFG